MSDLHCPATVLVARAAPAEYESDRPADAGGSLTLTGRRQAARLAQTLADRNVAMTYTSPLARAVQTAEIVAARLGGAVRVREGLSAIGPDVADAASSVTRVRDVLDEVADLHRGETVLVVSHGSAISLVLPRLVADLDDEHAATGGVPHCAPVELSADADGWTCTAWPTG